MQKCLTVIILQNNPDWSQTLDHPYRILITGGSESGKTKVLLNIISHQEDIDKIYLYDKNPYGGKYQLLINKREGLDLKLFSDSKALIQYSNNMLVVYKNTEECNLYRKRKVVKVFD